jgi:hypothetical protein
VKLLFRLIFGFGVFVRHGAFLAVLGLGAFGA